MYHYDRDVSIESVIMDDVVYFEPAHIMNTFRVTLLKYFYCEIAIAIFFQFNFSNAAFEDSVSSAVVER